jgi:putative flippase GtrA
MTASRPRRFRLLTAYGLVGIALMALYLCLSFGLSHVAGMAAYLASPVAFVMCIPGAYLAQSLLVFRSPWLNARQMFRFTVTMAVGFLISATAVPVLSGMFGLPETLSLLSVSALVPVANFIVFRFWVFD